MTLRITAPKVNRYVNENGNTLAIYKLTHNIPLSTGDYQELERVLTSELGSKEDYAAGIRRYALWLADPQNCQAGSRSGDAGVFCTSSMTSP